MQASAIRKEIQDIVAQRGCFIVDVTVSKDNDIVLSIESEEGIIEMDDCVAINNAFLEIFDQEKEDYALTVTSAGLDQPFKVLKQYIKAIGTEVEVLVKGGKKLTGTLDFADEQGIRLKYSVKEAVEGKKKKELVEHIDTFSFEEINAVTPHIVFE